MYDTRNKGSHPSRSGRRWRRTTVTAVALVVFALVASACGGGGNDSASANGSSSTDDNQDRQVEFAQCMRKHGIEDFPDPGNRDAEGGQSLSPEQANDPEFQSAQEACQDLLPEGVASPDSEEVQEALLKWTQCMRKHGVTDLPDPGSGQSRAFDPDSSSGPNSPVWQEAEKACEDLRKEAGIPLTPAGGPGAAGS